MKSVTAFLRRKGYPLREITKLLHRLQATEGHAAVDSGGGSAVEAVLQQVQRELGAEDLAESQSSLAELGLEPKVEHQHTLRVLLSAKEGPKRHLCFTRVGDDRWIYFVDASGER